MKTKFQLLFLGALLSSAFLTGCITNPGPAVATHPDASVDYTKYQTFAVVRPSSMPATRATMVTPLLLRSVRDEAAVAFAAKGLTKAPDDSADLLVLTHGGVDQKVDVTDWGFSYGRLGRGRYDVNQYKEGTLLVDVFDAKTKELVWRGTAVAEVSDSPSAEKIKAAIDAVVARYPN